MSNRITLAEWLIEETRDGKLDRRHGLERDEFNKDAQKCVCSRYFAEHRARRGPGLSPKQGLELR